MNFFINKYLNAQNTRLISLIHSSDNETILALGESANKGLITKINNNGEVLWTKDYAVVAERISFYRVVDADNNEFIVFGRFHLKQARRAQHLLMRINDNGDVIWLKKIYTGMTRNNIAISRVGDDFVICGWHNTAGTIDKIELHNVDGMGRLVRSNIIDLAGDDQVNAMTAIANIIALVGGTSSGRPWDAFLTIINSDFTIRQHFLFNHPKAQSVEDFQSVIFDINVGDGTDDFFLLGTSRIGNYTHSFLLDFEYIDSGIRINKSIAFDATTGHDANRKLLYIENHLFVLGLNSQTKQHHVVKLNRTLDIIWVKAFDLKEQTILHDFKLINNTELWFTGGSGNGNNDAILIKTDLDLNTCKTVAIDNIVSRNFEINWQEKQASSQVTEAEIQSYEVNITTPVLTKRSLCNETIISDNNWVQSPYLYLQSAGSLGKDAAKGFLLRWFFLKDLGNKHIAKGDYAANTQFYNKANDYVRIYRAKYDIKIQQTLDFQNNTPIHISVAEQRWVYRIIDQLYYLDFNDQQKYTSALNQYKPQSHPYEFIKAYGDGLLTLQIRDNLAFSVEALFSAGTEIKIETYSVQGNEPLLTQNLSSRKTLSQVTAGGNRIIAENISQLIFQNIQGHLYSFQFEMYADFLNQKDQQTQWQVVGAFALSKDTSEVFSRLEDVNRFKVNAHWQKFNDDAYVNVKNYHDRWSQPIDGLLAGIEKYLQLSNNDPKASERVMGQKAHDSDLLISYFDMLQLSSSDFHIARMLGMGTIDTPNNMDSDKYIYLAEYVTHASLDNITLAKNKQHLFMSLPTSLRDERLPQQILTLPVSYGIDIYQGTNQPLQLTDANGYVPFEAVRYINIKARILTDFSVQQDFFQPRVEFSLAEFSPAVMAGVEYKKQTENEWQKPEIAHDQNYKEVSNAKHFETLPLPFQEDSSKPLLIHDESNEGIHEYAVYGINIFSRASAIYNAVATNDTQFTKANTLIPPHHLHVQLIQPENPLMLTSDEEQQRLAAITVTDKTLVRITFTYNYLHDINYGYADKVNIFFREHLPRNIIGGVALITDDLDEKHAMVNSQMISYNSTGENILPTITAGLINNFKGGILVINKSRFRIEKVILTNSNGDYPRFKILKHKDRNTSDNGNGHLVMTQSYLTPSIRQGDHFMAIENMTQAESWDASGSLPFSIKISDPSWSTKTDSYINAEDKTISHEMRGVWDSVSITQKTDNQGNIKGLYDIEFDNFQLNNHLQYKNFIDFPKKNSVNWYKGIIRVPLLDSNGVADPTKQKKILDVISITNINSGQKLRLIVHDENPDNGQEIQLGSVILINFYPGYRVYLHKNNPHHFNANSILPQTGNGSKKTLIGLNTVDTTTVDNNGDSYQSHIGTPQILYAQEIINPVKPRLPVGPAYATPPDYFAKSTYSFSVNFEPGTFAGIFYRADKDAILKALYKKDTLDEIKQILPSAYEDEYFSQRLTDIINFTLPLQSSVSNIFPAYPLDQGSFNLPNPDNIDNGFEKKGLIDLATIEDLIAQAVIDVFIPLTEQPLVYDFIKGGNFIPSQKKQTIRDKYGKLLAPTDPDYDLSPMAKKIDGSNEVRFTDFTLDGEMSINTAYFYCAKAMNRQMSLSDASKILGPIQLINMNPPEAPVIRKITAQLANTLLGQSTAVNFEINAYSVRQNIKKIQIYRTSKAVDAMTPRTMQLVKDIDNPIIDSGIIQLQDDFLDDTFLPFGEALYYKLVALREIKYVDTNNNQVVEFVQSKASKTLLTNIVDVLNPEPPVITENMSAISNNMINSLSLSWTKTAYNATYYLSKMNSAGNWNIIFEIKSNDESALEYSLPNALAKVDDGKTIYHRFKVTVENASGLLNLRENILTI